MIRNGEAWLGAGPLCGGMLGSPGCSDQVSMTQRYMEQDSMKHDGRYTRSGHKTPLYTGKFCGKVHKAEGRATVCQQVVGQQVLQLTQNFEQMDLLRAVQCKLRDCSAGEVPTCHNLGHLQD